MKTKFLIAICIITLVSSCKKEAVTHPAQNSLSQTGSQTLRIGQHYQGGTIFYLDKTKHHGIVAASADLSGGAEWGIGIIFFVQTFATDTAFGKGQKNSHKIIRAQMKPGTYAALLCAQHKEGGFIDWFLPSQNELKMLYAQKESIGGFVSGYYWSSTELQADYSEAICVNFNSGSIDWVNKNTTFNVRPVRYF